MCSTSPRTLSSPPSNSETLRPHPPSSARSPVSPHHHSNLPIICIHRPMSTKWYPLVGIPRAGQ
eukprot:1212595-Pyramimonas_sp.AAC.1